MADNQQPSPEFNRICRKCGLTKPLEDFAKVYTQKTRGKSYRSHSCLVCFRAAHKLKERKRRRANPEPYREALRKHYRANRDKRSQQKRVRYLALKAEVYAAYGGFQCVCCGETEPCMLNIDHINNDGGEQRKEKRFRYSHYFYKWLKDQGFPDTFQILCYNCNLSKHRNGGTCAHQLRKGSTTIPSGSTAKRPEVLGIRCDLIG